MLLRVHSTEFCGLANVTLIGRQLILLVGLHVIVTSIKENASVRIFTSRKKAFANDRTQDLSLRAKLLTIRRLPKLIPRDNL